MLFDQVQLDRIRIEVFPDFTLQMPISGSVKKERRKVPFLFAVNSSPIRFSIHPHPDGIGVHLGSVQVRLRSPVAGYPFVLLFRSCLV